MQITYTDIKIDYRHQFSPSSENQVSKNSFALNPRHIHSIKILGRHTFQNNVVSLPLLLQYANSVAPDQLLNPRRQNRVLHCSLICKL